AFLVVTGDLADRAEDAAYKHLRAELDRCVLNNHLIIGNHDNRATFTHYFPTTPIDENGFVQYAIETSFGVLLMLDTVKALSHGGEYCEIRRQWLSDKLAEHADQPVFLFMHHPPFDLHLPCLDAIGLEDQHLFAEAISIHRNIRHIFFGHAHRPLSGSWLRWPFSSLRGTNHQVKLDFTTESIIYYDEPPEYSVVFVNDASVVVHTHTY
ncbi:MAG: Icc protein, partial [Gammaproteobacteria bacterium]